MACCRNSPIAGRRRARATLSDSIAVPGVYPAGRLDRDSEGLLLLTDDGRLQARIADPKFKLPKSYLVQVEGDATDASLEPLRRGVMLKDGMTRPAEVERIAEPELWPRDPPVRFRKSVPDGWLRLTIREGRNRQVRRMTAAVGPPDAAAGALEHRRVDAGGAGAGGVARGARSAEGLVRVVERHAALIEERREQFHRGVRLQQGRADADMVLRAQRFGQARRFRRRSRSFRRRRTAKPNRRPGG